MRVTAAFRTPGRTPFLQVAKSAIATVAAWFIAGLLIQGPPPVFAAIAALLVVQPSVNQSFAKAIERSIGVIIGVVLATLLALAVGDTTWVVAVAVTAALVVAWAVKMTAGTTNQVAISALLVLALGATTPGYAVDRILETILGAVIGIIVNVAIVPPVLLQPARDRVEGYGRELAASLDRLADALEAPTSPAQLGEMLISARLLRPMRDNARSAITAATESLAFNPRGRKHRTTLVELDDRLERFGPIGIQVAGMTRAVHDRYDDDLASDPSARAIAVQLRRAAHDLRREAALQPASPDPALTTPLQVIRPSEKHWVLIGSLLVDLHRIHEELSAPVP
jgi:hypothetical protein